MATHSERLEASGSPGEHYIAELRVFLQFLQTLWGLLAGVSVFFPLSNSLVHAIPLAAYGNDGVYEHVPPALISAIATVVALFVVFVSFAARDRMRSRPRTTRVAWVNLAGSLACLAAYLVVHEVYAEYAWVPWGWGSGDPRKLWMEIPLAALYVSFFALLTRAFLVVAIVEFYRPQDSTQSR